MRSKKSKESEISAADSQNLSSRLEELELLVKDYLDERNQWNAVLRNWIGKEIDIKVVTGDIIIGCLLWVDRYTIGIKDQWLRIVHKASITVITLHDDESKGVIQIKTT